ncbi:MAG: hypothetical protein SNG73_04595, partial [Rikenellaceae bacterium]
MRHRPITIDTLHSKQSPTSLETELHITRNRALHHSKQSRTSLETEPCLTKSDGYFFDTLGMIFAG